MRPFKTPIKLRDLDAERGDWIWVNENDPAHPIWVVRCIPRDQAEEHLPAIRLMSRLFRPAPGECIGQQADGPTIQLLK